MNLAEAIVTVVGSFFVLLGTVITVRGKKGGPPPVTNQQVSDAQPLDKRAFRMMLDLQGRVETMECELEQSAKDLAATNEKLEQATTDLDATNDRLSKLATENRRFRDVLRGVLLRLERIAEWVRSGHQPPPPFTADDIMSYILAAFPRIRDDEDDA